MSDQYIIARRNMVNNQVMTNRVTDERILKLMLETPRHQYVDDQYESVAYSDGRPIVHEDRTMLAPEVFAQMLQALKVKNSDRVLDIACGKGYSSVILSKMAYEVIAIDREKSLAQTAAKLVKGSGYENLVFVNAEHLEGLKEQGPYNAILINGRVDHEPKNLLSQLKDGGKLVCVMKYGDSLQKAVLFEKHHNGIGRIELFDAFAEII